MIRGILVSCVFSFAVFFDVLAQTPLDTEGDAARRERVVPLKNWDVNFGRPDVPVSDGLPTTLANHFISLTPCRVADTRGFGFTGLYGPPSLAPSQTRDFTIAGQCGIPAAAVAVSFNFTVAEMSTGGNLTVYPAGAVAPTVSTINWTGSTFVIANAAVVPLGAGAINVANQSAGATQLIIDVNGYFANGVVTNILAFGGLSGGGTGSVALGIAPGGVGDTALATNAVTSSKIANSSVTAAKIDINAVSAAKVSDEPGSAFPPGVTPFISMPATANTNVTLRTVTINVPAAGNVLVTASGYVNFYHTAAQSNAPVIHVTSTPSEDPLTFGAAFMRVPNAATPGSYSFPFSVVRRFPVSGAGAVTFYLVARNVYANNGLNEVAYPAIAAVYYPTSY